MSDRKVGVNISADIIHQGVNIMQDLRKKMSEPINVMTTEQVLRVALYPRVSSEEQALHGESLKAQEEALVAHAKEHHMKVVKIYRDEGNTARKPALKRPVLLELLEDVKAGKIDRILFTKLDRWTRNVSEFHIIQRVLDEHNVTWQAILEDYNTVTADGRLKLNIMLSVAENESDRLGERVRFVLNSKLMRKEVYFAAHTAPFGYMVVEQDGVKRLVKDPEAQPMVDYFFSQLKDGSIRNAVLKTNERFGLKRSYQAWWKMAKSPIYIGTVHGVEGFCEPYLTLDEWEDINHNAHTIQRSSKPGRTYLFSSVLICDKCGRRMTSKYNKNQYGVEYLYYRCCRKMDMVCTARDAGEKRIEKYLLENTRRLLEDYIISVDVQEAAPKPVPKKSETKKLQEKLRRLNVSYHAGTIDDDEYLEKVNDLKAAIALAKVEEECMPKAPDVEAVKEFLATDFEGIYKELTVEERKRFWRSIIKAIHIEDGEVVKVEYRA